MVGKMLAEMQPFRIRSYMSIARNCSNLTILLFAEQPFREIVHVDRAKL